MGDLIRRPNFLNGSKENEEYINHLSKHGIFQKRAGTVLRETFNTSRKKTIMGFLDVTIARAIATGHSLYQNPGIAKDNPLMEKLPPNAYVTKAWYEVLTTFTSAGDTATIALGVEVNDVAGIVAAVAIGTGTPWDAAAPKDCIQDGTTAAFGVKTTGYRDIVADVAVQDLTAGLLVLYVEYVQTYS